MTKTITKIGDTVSIESDDYRMTIDNYECQRGEYTRTEWIENLTEEIGCGGYSLTTEEAEEVCDRLDSWSNVDYFLEEDGDEHGVVVFTEEQLLDEDNIDFMARAVLEADKFGYNIEVEA